MYNLQQQEMAQQLQESKSLVGQVVGGSQARKYVIGEYVAGGSFGSFHYGIDQRDGSKVAIKLEQVGAPQPQLFLEFGFYKVLGRARFIPRILSFGPVGPGGKWNALVMELLGPSLREMNERCNNSFTILTIVQLAIQLLNLFEYVHDHGLLYRDIKPENFLFGPKGSDKWCTVCLIGMCNKSAHSQCALSVLSLSH